MDEKLRRQIAHAFAQTTHFPARLRAAGLTPDDIQTTADLEKLPVLPKDAVVQLQQADPPFGGLLGAPLAAVRHIFLSPGPLYEPEMEGDDDTQARMAQRALRLSGFGPGDVVLNTLSYHLVPAGLLLDQTLAALGCTVVPGGVGNSELQIKLMADLGVTGYVGAPSFLAHLLEKAAELGAPIGRDGRLRKAFFTAEPLPAPLRQRFVQEFGLSVGNGYATAELGFLALDTQGALGMQLMPEPIIELVDSDTGRRVGPGEVGEVVVTNFSRAYPLIRLGTGDLAVNLDPNPGQSRQEERAIVLVGRRGEAVKVRGMFVHPNQLRFAAARIAPFRALQGVVTREGTRDRLTVRIAGGDPSTAETLLTAFQAMARVKVDAVEFVDELPPNAPGMVDARDWS